MSYPQMYKAIGEALSEAAADNSISIAVLTGKYDGYFFIYFLIISFENMYILIPTIQHIS